MRQGTPKAGFGGFGGVPSTSPTLSYLTPPPDFSNIPLEVVVAFKSLLKKASATKEKALQDVLTHEQNRPSDSEGPEESVIQAYIQLYPRLSIDDSARVRELSHQVLIQLLNSAKKRIAKHLPLFVGPWLAGTFDRDRRVAKAANDGLASFLQTKEKEVAFWKSVQTRALDYARTALKETPTSLSDERSTTKQDSDAKYYRVVGASLCLTLNLLAKGDLNSLKDGLATYVEVDALWSLVKAEDPFVRRSFYQLIRSVLDAAPELLQPCLQQLGRALIADSFKANQTGSASDFLKALTTLTRQYPKVWGTQQHPTQRLEKFVSRGSQGGSDEYWRSSKELLSLIAEGFQPPSAEMLSALLGSIRKAILDRLETRSGRQQAFNVYAHALVLFLPTIPLSMAFVEDNVSSLTRQFLHPNPDNSTPTPSQPEFLVQVWEVLTQHPNADARQIAEKQWNTIVDEFLIRVSNSLPEVSERYQASQLAVAAEGERWFSMVSKFSKAAFLDDVALPSSRRALQSAMDLLLRRNFKPFGCAALLQSAYRHCPSVYLEVDPLTAIFPPSSSEHAKVLVTTPSLPYIVSDLHEAAGDRLEDIWEVLFQQSAQISDRVASISAVKVLISIPSTFKFAQDLPEAQQFLVSVWSEFARSSVATPVLAELAETSLDFNALTPESAKVISGTVIGQLEEPLSRESALRALELILRRAPESSIADDDLSVRLITSLLALTEVSDTPIAEKAKGLFQLLKHRPTESSPLSRILASQLHEAGPASLDIDTLVTQAVAAVQSKVLLAEDVFPSSVAWQTELTWFLDTTNPSLSLTSSMEGSHYLVQSSEGMQKPAPGRDSKGRSSPARMALFTAKLLSSGVELSSLPLEFQLELLYLLCVTDALAADQLALSEENRLWRNIRGQDTDDEILEYTELASKEIGSIVAASVNWRDFDMSGDSLVERLVNFMLETARGFNATAFYTAKALASLLQSLVKTHGPLARLEEWLTKLGLSRVTPSSTFVASAILVGMNDALTTSKTIATLCARLFSEIPGNTIGSPRTLPFLVLLNLCMAVYDESQIPVEPRKQVLVLQQLAKWTDTPDEMDYRLAAETCKAITRIFPSVREVYGPFWEKSIQYCLWLWDQASRDDATTRLPYVYASLKLMQALRGADDINDDLEDALVAHRNAETAALIGLLSLPNDASATVPSQLVDALISRAVSKLPDVKLEELSDVYQAVASPSRDVQKAAFGLLHKTIPAAQEEISVNVIIEKKPANLPAELLSLLLNAPNPDDYTDEELYQFPAPVRSYLLAWHLVFDAYNKASYRVRSDYTENLKKDDHLGPLLGFLADVLGHALARAIDLDKERFTPEHVRSYSIDLADSEPAERDMNWLLIHLFYLILKFVPGLFKSWYFDCPSKQTKVAIQSWMGRFFSPLIISDLLDEVTEWSTNQGDLEGETDAEALEVKVNKPVREITASFPVDDDFATIQIVVPQSYPLEPVDVMSVKRVAIKEEKWQSWLKGIKAVIMFGNCSLVDGLMAFRRNISLAVKDQEECAICYSIVAQDKSLPDKKCGTCNHYFHRYCLYKWFHNSGKNTCPLCRNPIDYLGSDTSRRKGGR
ncbi:hypothetical protein QBC40DRAFT_35318 [Triangularia verruculosa]|uniref:E3 ubiquitin-protein ligase listerin n=1 Tax=Triangularia verruculosa TaxID=2587418 RepID=A0AAN6X6H5_9PEZI|nr:hypothetical protein QBC40DRAFT_35318 [Triangularia verruculosa]